MTEPLENAKDLPEPTEVVVWQELSRHIYAQEEPRPFPHSEGQAIKLQSKLHRERSLELSVDAWSLESGSVELRMGDEVFECALTSLIWALAKSAGAKARIVESPREDASPSTEIRLGFHLPDLPQPPQMDIENWNPAELDELLPRPDEEKQDE